MGLEFVLFAILGWCAFAPPPAGNGKLVLMIVFIVLMILWLALGITGYSIPSLHFGGRG